MKKILFLFFISLQIGFAQVKFEAKSEKNVYAQNEKFLISFEMNVDGDDFVPPSLENFFEEGPMISVQEYSDSNGRRTFSKAYKYLLTPKKQGVFVIKEAQIVFNGKIHKTIPIKISVTKAIPVPRNTNSNEERLGEGVILVSEVSNKNPYVNQPVKVVYKLYFDERFVIRNLTNMKKPKYNGFWSEFFQENRPNAVEAQRNGRNYAMVVLGSSILYPLEAGNKTIEPFTFDANVEFPSNQRDMFGQSIYTVTQKSLSSGNQSINVKPLPESGKPINFTGATGNLQFTVTSTKTSLKHGESLDLILKVSGNGNLKLFSLPKPEVPTALEMYDPEHKENINTSTAGMSGNITDKYSIVPQYKGKYPIKPIRFSYFDFASGTYKTIVSKEIMIDVIDGPTEATAPFAAKNNNPKSDKNKDLVFQNIKTKTELVYLKKHDFLYSTKFYVLMFLPFLMIPFIILMRKRKELSDSDTTGNRLKMNNRLAKKYLSQAKKHVNNKEQFYVSLEKAMHNFLKAKLNIETTEMSKTNIEELLLSRNINPETVTGFINLTENCEIARYAPSTNASIQQDYDKAVLIITDLEKQLKN